MAETLQPGDVLTCTACGARSRPLWHTGAQWREGFPLLLTWEHGPEPRTFVENSRLQLTPPYDGRCCWCLAERREAASSFVVEKGEADEWVATPGATIPDWLAELIKERTVEAIIARWGEGARFNRRIFAPSSTPSNLRTCASSQVATPTPPPSRPQLSLF